MYELGWLKEAHVISNSFHYSLGEEKKELDLTPYLEAIYAQAGKGDKRYEEKQEPFIIETEELKLILTSLDGKMLETGEIILEEYVDGYLLLK